MSLQLHAKPTRLLIVDDYPPFAEVMRDAFDKHFETIAVAYDDGDLLEKTRVAMPDIVLLDLTLSLKTGHQVIAEWKREFPDVRLIFMTAGEATSSVIACGDETYPVVSKLSLPQIMYCLHKVEMGIGHEVAAD